MTRANAVGTGKRKSKEGAQGGERDLKFLKRHQGHWATGIKDLQWPEKAGAQLSAGDRRPQLKQGFPVTKEGSGQKQLLCKVTGD